MNAWRPRVMSPVVALLLAAPVPLEESAPAVGLNHLTLIPDSATYAAIATSAFLRDTFALFAQSPVHGSASDGIALFGRSTYVEFRRPAKGAPSGTSSVALGTDERGALRAVALRLTSEVGAVRIDSLTRTRDSTDVPWLYQLVASDARMDSGLALRVVEYHPRFLHAWYGTAPAATTSVARAKVLAMQATSTRRRYPFLDIVGVKVATSSETENVLLAHCRAVGWRVQPTTSGQACVGSDVRLFLVPSSQSGARGVLAFTMRLTSTARLRGATTRRFGHSTLRISRTGFATWEFAKT